MDELPEIDLNDRSQLEKRIVGALRSAIHAHGPITEQTAPSAAKRVIGTIKDYNRESRQQSRPADPS